MRVQFRGSPLDLTRFGGQPESGLSALQEGGAMGRTYKYPPEFREASTWSDRLVGRELRSRGAWGCMTGRWRPG